MLAAVVAALSWSPAVGACEEDCSDPGVFLLSGGTVTLIDGDPEAVAPSLASEGSLISEGNTGLVQAVELVDSTEIVVHGEVQ
jgi:hypothetical protein